MSPRILVVYYSRTGNTRQVARELASILGADVDEILDPDSRKGLLGYLRSGRQAFWRRIVPLEPPQIPPDGYDLVVVGTPIWNVSLSSPVRSYLREHRRVLTAVAFFCTCGGMGIDRVFQQMSEESGLTPIATLPVLEAALGTAETRRAMAHFARRIQLAFTGAAKRRTA